jgi:hypothetical protein
MAARVRYRHFQDAVIASRHVVLVCSGSDRTHKSSKAVVVSVEP